jgi:hypothetical protein
MASIHARIKADGSHAIVEVGSDGIPLIDADGANLIEDDGSVAWFVWADFTVTQVRRHRLNPRCQGNGQGRSHHVTW